MYHCYILNGSIYNSWDLVMCVLYPLKTVVDCSYVMLGTAVFFYKNDVYASNIWAIERNGKNDLLSQY